MRLHRASLGLLLSILVSCSDQARSEPSIGDAYVGPTTLNLRRELAVKSPVSATVKHGDKLDILEYKHRLVRVRTPQGLQGWTDMRQLLTPEQMNALHQMAESASKYPSQGTATVFESLNMHTEPSRTSPSFWQVPENGKVDVVAHKLAPRTAVSVTKPVTIKPAPVRKKSTDRPQTRFTPPPRPAPPKLPENWLALSVPKLAPPAEPAKSDKPSLAAAHVPMDDWSLVRTPDGKAGWVLTRPLSMAIPDEVAQYAEGHRITSYFSLGQIEDGNSVKNNWLWTTISKGSEPYEFDSFRVFVWSRKRHRYETAYIERNVIGHYPTQINSSGSDPSFSLLVEDAAGHLYRKTYSFDSYRIRMVNKVAYDSPSPIDSAKPAEPAKVAEDAARRSWFARLKDRAHRLFR